MRFVANRHSRHSCAAVLAAVLLCTAGGCVFTRDAISPLNAEAPAGRKTREVTTPAKAHLKNGSVVLFPQGFTIGEGVLRGAGEEYDISRARRILVSAVPLDQVAAIEVYSREMRPVASTAGVLVGGPILVAVWAVSGTILFIVLVSL